MNIIQRLAVRDDQYHGYVTTKWINPDISPLPPSRRTWGYVDYLGFWYGNFILHLSQIIVLILELGLLHST